MTFAEENNQLLDYILETKFYENFRKQPQGINYTLELNITASCNQSCEYCYLVKNGDKIYPKEIRTPKVIIQNLKYLIDYFLENNMHPKNIDLFSGEIWGTELANNVFDLLLDAIKRNWEIKRIIIPSNMSFIFDENKRNQVEFYINEFRKLDCRLIFSASIDGLLIEQDSRPFTSYNVIIKNQSYFDTIFTWCKKYNYAFHPMVAASTIEKWCDNYDWWNMMFEKYSLDPLDYGMFLEVRDDEWSVDKIEAYLKFLNHMIDVDFGKSSIDKFSNFVIVGGTLGEDGGYVPYKITNQSNGYECTIDKSLIVRLGDLAIGPCHRTSYDKFLYGKYHVENGKITGIDAKNIQFANMVLFGTHKLLSRCCLCPVAMYCTKGCLGAQYEANGEVTLPCDTVCQLNKAKLIFLYHKYKKMGVIDYLLKNGNIVKKASVELLEYMIEQIKSEEPALWNYWNMKTKENI